MVDVTAAGAKLFISDTTVDDPDSITLSGFQGKSYTEIGRVQSLPNVGDQVQTSNFTELGKKRVQYIATFFDGGGGDVVVTFDSGDTGQQAAIDAIGENRAYKIELDDAPPGSGTTPTKIYVVAINTNTQLGLGDGNNVITRTFSLQFNSDVAKEDAA